MKINAILNRKENEYSISNCIVEKVVELKENQFKIFRENMLSDYKFIDQNKEHMYVDENGVYHCLLVLGENQNYGILIESEGSAYARYSSFIPNARQLVNQEMKIESYNSRKIITQEEADIMCAKHLLWLYDENGGKQADFTNYDLTDICLEHNNLHSAIFINTKLKNTNLENSQLCFADFSYAKIQDSQFNNCDMEESIFDDAYITDCEFENVITTNSNISEYLENQEQEQIESDPALSM